METLIEGEHYTNKCNSISIDTLYDIVDDCFHAYASDFRNDAKRMVQQILETNQLELIKSENNELYGVDHSLVDFSKQCIPNEGD